MVDLAAHPGAAPDIAADTMADIVADTMADIVADTVADALVRHPKLCAPGATVADVRTLFDDDHVHAALVVDGQGRLLAMVERADLDPTLPAEALAVGVGRLEGRVVAPRDDLETVRRAMLAAGRRRLAAVDADGVLIGLLCLKRSGTGFCSDDGVAARRPCAPEPHADH